jgi:hypothetical protein
MIRSRLATITFLIGQPITGDGFGSIGHPGTGDKNNIFNPITPGNPAQLRDPLDCTNLGPFAAVVKRFQAAFVDHHFAVLSHGANFIKLDQLIDHLFPHTDKSGCFADCHYRHFYIFAAALIVVHW